MSYEHKPVLLDEVIEALQIRADGFYIDATFGRGGHSSEILQRLGTQGRLLMLDKDPDAVAYALSSLGQDNRCKIMQGSFAMLNQHLQQANIKKPLAGLLLDLGVSSPQLDDPTRGFSFRCNAPLDMRMNPEHGQSVVEWLHHADEKDIANIIYQYGEERASRRIAKAIVNKRSETPITSTRELAELVASVIPVRKGKKNEIHPATKTFQALRIFINHELEDLQAVLPQAMNALQSGGRLAVISFHSLEDRIVKRFIRDQSRPEPLPPELPLMPAQNVVKLKTVGKKIRASSGELETNPRARSAVLRVAERN